MKTAALKVSKRRSGNRHLRLYFLTTLSLFSALTAVAAAPSIPNPSFEADAFTVWPGYVSSNGAITGWTTTDPTRAGLNPASGSPFADNGAIPHGKNVAFIQSGANSSLSTVISDLTIDRTYKVNFRVNARSSVGSTPNLKVSIDGLNIINTAVTPVGGANSYKYFAFDFTATATSQVMTLTNDAAIGDHTVLLDDFSIAPRNSGWSYAAWNDDASSGIDGARAYTHAYSFGSSSAATINGVNFAGIASADPSLLRSFSTAGLPNIVSDDPNNVTGGSRQLAKDFLWGGARQSIAIDGLTVGKAYMATIYSVGWENGTRAATFSVGNDRLTVNQDQFGDDNGIRVSYNFTANASSIALTYVPLQANTFHTYGFSACEVPQPVITNDTSGATLVVSNLADSGPGSLRQAISSAQSGDIITFATSGVIRLKSPLSITTSLTIVGHGPTNVAVDGNASYRVFDIGGGIVGSVSGLTIQNGGFPNGGGLGNAGTLVLSNCVVTGNRATANSGFGGAIHNKGLLSLITCTISHNRAGDGANGPRGADGTIGARDGGPGGFGGPGGDGGGIYNEGVLDLAACTINDNAAGRGGDGGAGGNGIMGLVLLCENGGDGGAGGRGGYGGSGGGVYNAPFASVAVTNCAIHGNSAGNGGSGGAGGQGARDGLRDCGDMGPPGDSGSGGSGGGIFVGNGGTLTLTRSTVSSNSAVSGGGIMNQNTGLVMINSSSVVGNFGSGMANFSGTVTMADGTFSGNSALWLGGGILNFSGTVTIASSTFSGNSATLEGGGILNIEGNLFMTNTIVASNTASALANVSGPFSGPNNLTDGNPLLAPLGHYGGPTPTMPPLAGSPAVDAGTDSGINFLATDQRGYPRLSGARVDIGAVELQVVTAANAPVLSNATLQPEGTYAFRFTSSPDATFAVLGSTNLNDWEYLGPPVHSSPGEYQFTDPAAPDYPKRFYKIRSP